MLIKKLLFVSILLVCTRVAQADALPTSEPSLYIKSLFTHGSVGNPDNALVDYLRNLIQQAKPGSDIKFSIFLFYYENPDQPILLDLIAAAARGVNVQILMDLPEEDQVSNRSLGAKFQEKLTARLAEAAKGRSDSWVRGSAGFKNHTKIFLFSDSAGSQNWIITGSENLTDKSNIKHQANFVIHDKHIYDVYEKFWAQIKNNAFKDFWIDSENPQMVSYFFPQLGGHDFVYSILDRFIQDPHAKGTLYISMARWNQDRLGLAMKLVQIAEKGLKIEIVTRENPAIVSPLVLQTLKNKKNIFLFTNDVSQINIHSKYMLFDGVLEGENKKIVWAGSHNFTGAALRSNYENWSEITLDGVFADHLQNFNLLKKISSK